MKTNWMKTGVIAVVVAAGVWMAFRSSGSEDVHTATAPNVTMEPVDAQIQTARPTVSPIWLEVTGSVETQLSAPVATKVQGRILRVLVREGDRVRKGQSLVALDARDLDASVEQASANVRSASVGYENARVASRMEDSMSQARIAQAEAQVSSAEAALQAARARQELVQSGPRRQEKTQASLAVEQARAGLTLAENNLRRMERLHEQGAIARQMLETTQSQYDVARAQYETTVQSQSMAEEGSRSEDIRAAQEAVRQAQGALNQARAGLRQARAAALQADVRRSEIRAAAAQVGQGRAALRMAQVTRDYADIVAPFDGVVTRRLADPGAMASPGVPLMVIQGGAQRLLAVVPERALANIQVGQAVPIRLDALRDREIVGRVDEIAPQGDSSSHTFVVKIRLPEGSGAKAGMFGRARFRTGQQERILVPSTAVTEREGLQYLYSVLPEGKAHLRLVTIGEPEADRVPVLSGLRSGERYVVEAANVTDGAAIREAE